MPRPSIQPPASSLHPCAHAWPSHEYERTRPMQGFRILLVDDHRDSADAMSAKLGLLGNTVFTAYDGPSAIETYLAWRPEVLILDLGMPDMDGYALARRIRATAAGRHALLIALTGFNSRDDRRRSAEAGIDHHSTKPMDAIILQRVIETRFQARRLTPTPPELLSHCGIRIEAEPESTGSRGTRHQPPDEACLGAEPDEDRNRDPRRLERLLS